MCLITCRQTLNCYKVYTYMICKGVSVTEAPFVFKYPKCNYIILKRDNHTTFFKNSGYRIPM
jgi:hypothetical protein